MASISSYASKGESTHYSRSFIFNELASKTCKVLWGNPPFAETSGSFVKINDKEIQVITCFHNKSWDNSHITVIYNTSEWMAKRSQEALPQLAAYHDIGVLDIDKKGAPLEVNPFYIGKSTNFVAIGEDVYFAGFPLGEDYPSTQIGYVCSLDEPRRRFKIDATVLSGHSGGPVARLKKDTLELIGIVSSQLVDLTQEFLEISQLQPDRFRAWNDPASNYAGDHSVIEAIKQLNHAVLSNISTGISSITFITDPLFPEVSLQPDVEKQEMYAESLVPSGEHYNTSASSVSGNIDISELLAQRELEISTIPSSVYKESKVSELPVMKKTELEDQLKKLGWHFRNHGAGHDIWTNGRIIETVPRHTEIKKGLALKILKTAQSSPPSSVEVSNPIFPGEGPVNRLNFESKLREYGWFLSRNEENDAVWSNETMVIRFAKYETIERDRAIELASQAQENPRV